MSQVDELFQEEVDCEELMNKILELRASQDDVSERLDSIKSDVKSAEEQLIKAMQKANQKSVKRTDGVGFTVCNQARFYTKVEDRETQREYLRIRGEEAMLSVNARTWNTYCRELEKNEEAIPHFVKKDEFKSVKITGRKKRS